MNNAFLKRLVMHRFLAKHSAVSLSLITHCPGLNAYIV